MVSSLVISRGKVEEIRKMFGLTTEALLMQLVTIASQYARPPISGYKVGAAAMGKSKTLYLGVNLEFPGSPISQTVHAEQFVVANAFNHGEKELELLAVTADPCGHCRQWLNELGKPLTILVGKRRTTLKQILPRPFGPKDLGISGGLFTPANNKLRGKGGRAGDPIYAAALKAASRAYSPYSRSPSGVALKTKSGKIYTGSYLENAAFNPSLPPLQGAIVALVAAGESYDAILEAHLVEKRGAKVRQEGAALELLHRIARNAKFRRSVVDG